MTSATPEDPTRNPDANEETDAKATADEVNTGELELLELTPTPMVLPVRTGEPGPPPLPPAVAAGPKQPPPLPPRVVPPPPPQRATQSRPVETPQGPARPLPTPEENAGRPGAAPPLRAPVPGAIRGPHPTTAPGRLSPSPDVPAPPPRPSQTRAAVAPPPPPSARRSPSPEATQPAAPPVMAPLSGAASSLRLTVGAALPTSVPPSAPSLTLRAVPLPAVSAPAPRPAASERFAPDAAIADARKRVEAAAAGDRMALTRARTELGLLLEVAGGDAAAALTEYRAAHGMAAHLVAPIAAARRLTPLRPAAPLLALVEAEVRATTEPTARLTRQLDLGLLLAASGAPSERTGQAFREVLAARPGHPGALRGLETALFPALRGAETPQQTEALAAHLETMAAVLRNDTRLSAWLEVERGQHLERLGRADAARAAFEAALLLDGRIGPVRDAYTRHLLLQGQIEALIKAWAAEASLETDAARAARLLYFAGRLAAERLDQKPQAIDLFERCASSETAAQSTKRAALRELVSLYEATGNLDMAAATADQVLALARESERSYWHHRLAAFYEALGRHSDMAAHAHQVLAVEPDNEPMRDKLDHALAALGKHAERMAMLSEQASHASTQHARIELLQRAAAIAEHDMGRPDLALLSLRSAWAIEPGNPDVTDAIVRLLLPGTPPSLTDPDDPARARARIDFYIEAANNASDSVRKVAHLEKLASIWEDEVRDPERAAAVFTEILVIEPRRRSAILGLARSAGRAGNARELLRALLLEADQAGDDVVLERSLLLRAAVVASRQLNDVDGALDMVKRVLAHIPGDPAALRAAFRIHERAGRQAEALAQLRLLLGQNKKGPGSYAVQAEIARFLEERMHRTADALTAWREAHRMEPANPTPRAEIRRILLANGDYRAVAEELAALAGGTTEPTERGELFLEAAEIYDDRLNDAERAIPLLAEARTCLPDGAALVDRLDRAYLRTGKRSERLALLHATETPQPRTQLALASLQAEERDPSKALKRLADLAGNDLAGTAALRIAEHALRRTERWNELALVLRKQIECFATPEAKLGSVFELVTLEEYGEARAPEGEPTACELLARFAPDNLLHHELLLRRSGLHFGSPVPAAWLAASLATLAAAAPDPFTAASLQLLAGLVTEHADEEGLEAQKEALVAYAIALEGWPDCVTAARGARRLALRLGETETFVKAAAALGTLELDPATRCERLLEAADGYRGRPEDAALAFDLVCQALTQDPNSSRAADAVIVAVGQGHDAGKASDALRTALERAILPDQAAKLGTALAHVAVAHLGDQTVALEALRRARKRAPKHVGNLLALADVSNALGLHAEAIETATAAMGISRDPAERLRAGITLAEVHLRSPAFRDTARREATEAEKLAEQAGGGSSDLIARLGAVYRQLGDEASAERVLISALMLGGDNSAALDNLVTMYGADQEAGRRIAAALHKVKAQAEASGQPRRPELLAALGKVEATMLGQKREGIDRLREAAILAPGRVETYQALAEAHGSAHDEAARDISSMLPAFGRSAPNAAQLAAMLALLARECRLGQQPSVAEAAQEVLALIDKSSSTDAEPARRQALPRGAPAPDSLARATLVSSLFGAVEQAPLLDVAAVLSEPLAKLLRQDPETLGLSTRDRLTARAAHPVRALADRVARGFGEPRFDLYLDAPTTLYGRLLPGDPPALVLPPGFADQPEIEQAAMLAHLLTYVALGIPWVEEIPANDLDGILFGALRVGMDLWGQGEISPEAETAANSWRQRIAKAAGRKGKRALEDSARRLRPQPDTSAWREAVRIASLRAAYVVTGDLRAALGLAAKFAPDLAPYRGAALAGKLFSLALGRELVVFALSEAGVALRRAAGTL
ncbi:MAG: hypothetical protein JXP73_17600 [Deltaproteobacteria bacterium]|nr:hypothetical protein [Deltaproteobacteria bacterium]